MRRRDEAGGAAAVDAAPVVGSVPDRRENHERRVLELQQELGDLEAVEIGKLDVEENEIGLELLGGLQRGGPVLGLADDRIPLGLEQRPRAGSEARMVVDDQDCHIHSLASIELLANTGFHTLYGAGLPLRL